MAEVIKTIEDIENIFREAVLKILKLDINENHKRVRFPWGSDLKNNVGSMPSWKKGEDVCFIYSLPQDDLYNRGRHRTYIDNPDNEDLIRVDEHTDVHLFNFVNYGPNAYECARNIRDGLFTLEITRLLEQNDFFLIPDVSSIIRVPELYNGEWWNRVDFSARFNEYVRREEHVNAIKEINIYAQEVSRKGHEVTENAKILKNERRV